MNKMLMMLFHLFLWMLPFNLLSQSCITDPARPVRNQPVTIMLETDKMTPEPISVNLILKKQLDLPADTLSMINQKGFWTASTQTSDTSLSALFFYFKGVDATDNPFSVKFNQGPFGLFFYTPSGDPVMGAHMASALVWSGFGSLAQPDLDKALKSIEEELKLYPSHFQARLLKYTLLMKHEKNLSIADFLIREDVNKTLKSENESIASLKFALQAYQMIEYEDAIDKIQALLIKKEPGGEQNAVRIFNEIMTIEDAEQQKERLETFINQYLNSRMREIALSQLISIYIEQDDSTEMLDVGDRLLLEANTMSGASGLSALAGILAEKASNLQKAQNYIEKSLTIIQNVDPKDHPPEISDADWLERIHYITARYLDISGWIYFQLGEYHRALDLLESASINTMEPGILYHLAAIQDALHNDEAIKTYARVIAFGGAMADSAKEKLNLIWKNENRNPSELDSLLSLEKNLIEDDYTEKILNRRHIQQLPAFSAERLNGGSVRSSDIREKNTLICFIATWSEASARMMDAMIDISYQRDDIQIYIIAVDRNPSDVSQYVRDNHIPSQVLLSNQAMEDAFGLKGVPVLYIIDSRHRINFQHKGYRPDIIDILNIELDHLK